MGNTKFIGIGLALLVTGLAAVGARQFGFTDIPAVFMGGAFAAGGGAILMVMGVFALMGAEYRPREGLRAGDATLFSTGLIRCMIAISIADNHLDDSEISEIARIHKHLTKNSIGEAVIRETAEAMMAEGATIEHELSVIRGDLNNELKQKLIVASLYILAADGEIGQGELIMLENIREGLKLSFRQVENIKKQFLERRNLA